MPAGACRSTRRSKLPSPPPRARSRPPARSSSRWRRSRRARWPMASTCSGACASWIDISALPRRAAHAGAALHPRVGRRRLGSDHRRAVPRLHADGGAARRRRRRVPAVRLRAVAGQPGERVRRDVGDADERSAARDGAHRLHAALQHERAAGGVDRLRPHRRRPADRPANRRPPLRRLGRAAPGARVGTAVAGRCRRRGRPSDRAGRHAAALQSLDGVSRHARKPGRQRRAGGARSGRAGALADDVVLRRPARRPRRRDRRRSRLGAAARHEGRLPARPHRAGAVRRGGAPPRTRGRAGVAVPAARARAGPPFDAVRQLLDGRFGTPPAGAGTSCCSTTRATRSRCSGRSCGTSTAAIPSACASGRRAACPECGTTTTRCGRTSSASTRSASRSATSIRRPRRSAARRCARTRACRGRCTPSPTSWRCRGASTKARSGCASTSRSGPSATGSPATCGGTRGCSGSRRSTPPACCGSSTSTSAASRWRSRCTGSTRHRCCGGCTCMARTSARAPKPSSPAGPPRRPRPATTPSTTSTACWRCSPPATLAPPRRGSRAAPSARSTPATRGARTTRWHARSGSR